MSDIPARRRIAFIGDAHGNFQGAKLATRLLKEKGISNRIYMGDLTHLLTADFTKDAARPHLNLHQHLISPSEYRKGIEDGLYSNEQLERIANPHQSAIESLRAHARRTYQEFKSIDPDMKTIGGNWDIEGVIEEVFAGNFKQTGLGEENGLKILWGSGGGTPPLTGGTIEGYLADYPDKDVHHSRELAPYLRQPRGPTQEENEIDALVMHVPPPQVGQHVDQYALQVQEQLLHRHQMGLPLPKVIVHGHHHLSTANIAWNSYKDKITGEEVKILTFSPGVLALDHNDGSHGAFTIAEFDEKNRLAKVEEYHVSRTLDGHMNVRYHGDHVLDHDKQEVTFTRRNELVAHEKLEDTPKDFFTLDNNYSLAQRGLSIKYEGLSGREADLLLRQNLSILGGYVKETGERIKLVLDTIRNDWLAHAKDPKHEFSDDELDAKKQEVVEKLADQAAKVFGINLNEVTPLDETAKVFHQALLTKAAFGITLDDILQATNVKKRVYEEIPFNWGSELLQKSSEDLYNQGQQYILAPITESMWMSMVDEVYAPLNVKRIGMLSRQKAISLYAKGYNNGLVLESEATDTGAYEAQKDFHKNPKTAQDIDSLFGISYAGKEMIPNQSRQLSEDATRTLQGKIDQGLPVLKDLKGDYVLSPQGKVYLDSSAKSKLSYQPTSMKQLLDEGKALLITGGDSYFASLGGQMIPLDLEKENIDPAKYDVIPIWQVALAQKEQERVQQNALHNLLQQAKDEGYDPFKGRQQINQLPLAPSPQE